MPPTVSIIIPALNEEKAIGGTLRSLSRLKRDFEVIVVDGGSRDRTREIISESTSFLPNLQLISCEPGRGPQLNAGAWAARGNILLFLHADAMLPADAIEMIEHAIEDCRVVGGNFKLVFGGSSPSSKVFTGLDAIRRWFGIYYGDSVIWVRRSIFDRLGGFINAPIMEDFDFCRRLERSGRTVCLPHPVIASPRRWARGRALQMIIIWTLIQWLYLLGVSPDYLAWLYYPKSFRLRNRRPTINNQQSSADGFLKSEIPGSGGCSNANR